LIKHRAESGLSTTATAPISQLFKFPDVTGALWGDFGSTAETRDIKEQILKATGGVDLSNAHGIFMTNLAKRVDTILDKADSVTYLMPA
jgi:hypothetical protein